MHPVFDTHFHIIDPLFPVMKNQGPSQRARRPFRPSDMDLIRETLGDALAQKVFFDNAVEFYRPTRLAR